MQPAYTRNQRYISHKNFGRYKKLVKPKVYYEIKNLSLIAEGKPPCPRYLHSACFVQGSTYGKGRIGSSTTRKADNSTTKPNRVASVARMGFIAIFGGRNDLLYQKVGCDNIALNDLHLFDIANATWMIIALYG